MSELLRKKCKKHGELDPEYIGTEANPFSKSGFSLRCLICKREKDARWRNRNVEQHRASASRKRNENRRLYREGLTNEIPKANLWAQKDRKEHPEKYREAAKRIRDKKGQLRNTQEVCRRRGISISQYNSMIETQNNLCAICLSTETKKARTPGKICQLSIDHNHTTNLVRGLLCHDCNTMLGKFEESIQTMNNAIKYLEKHGEICKK